MQSTSGTKFRQVNLPLSFCEESHLRLLAYRHVNKSQAVLIFAEREDYKGTCTGKTIAFFKKRFNILEKMFVFILVFILMFVLLYTSTFQVQNKTNA